MTETELAVFLFTHEMGVDFRITLALSELSYRVHIKIGLAQESRVTIYVCLVG